MKRYIYILVLATAAFQMAACNKYLDVQPEDKFLENQVFSSETAIQQTLNGIYLNMSGNRLYGGYLTTTIVEVLAQRYNISSTQNLFTSHNSYSYASAVPQATFNEIWTGAYANILNLNNFITRLDATTGVISPAKARILKGEAIGLRAFLHFDLLRLFGPIYATADSTAPAIPYYTLADAKLQPIIAAKQAMDSVLADLSRAEALLSEDPVRENGMMASLLNDGTDFYRLRNRRMNYYAVKGLSARAWLYRGNKAEARAQAEAVLTEGEKWLPWMDYKRITSDLANPDRIFSPEIIFGLQCDEMYSNQQKYFSGIQADWIILAPQTNRLATTFDNDINDYRYNFTWLVPSDGGKSYRTFFKYADIQDKNSVNRFFMPLLRKSELYYILAECETNAATAIDLLNKVRFNRGITALPATATVSTEVQKEYTKEFFGEGQLFYFYKRKNLTAIPRGSTATGNIAMSKATYVLPLPLSETTLR
ncbi:RagB/SusD family nutrient uptake outer membrane protein [Chitinophaga lutea]